MRLMQPPSGNALHTETARQRHAVEDVLTGRGTGMRSERPEVREAVLNCRIDVGERTLPAPEREKMVEHAALAHTVYAGELQENLGQAKAFLANASPEAWKPTRISDELMSHLREACPGIRQLDDGRLCDMRSGLMMQIFENEKTQSLTLAFGGTSAGNQKGPLVSRLLWNPLITARQWSANISSATGISMVDGPVPDSYIKAARLAAVVEQHVNGGDAKEKWHISLTGHSKGGAEAEYAALTNRLPAVCFSTPELSRTLLKTLSTQQLEAGRENIRHYFVEGDVAPQISSIVGNVVEPWQAHVGRCFWMEPTPEVGNGPLKWLWCHDLFFKSVLHEAERGHALQTVPQQDETTVA
jgi:hypothetical protein